MLFKQDVGSIFLEKKVRKECGGTKEIVQKEKGKVTVESWKRKPKQTDVRKRRGFNNVNERDTIEKRL